MIYFQDFAPRQVSPGGFFQSAQFELLQGAVAAANEWIQQHNARVLNVETVVLPNIYNPGEQGTVDPSLRTRGEMYSHWYQVVRVWYEN